MAVRSSFFNSVNGDRRYLANNFAEYFASFIANGIFLNPSNTLQVYEKTNMKVTVKPGKGWINGYFAVNEYDYDLTLDNADGVLNRIDRIVLRLDFNARSINIAVKKGAFASTPVAPTLQRDADAHELALADVYVAKGATTIKQSNITDQRLNNVLCGVVHGTVSQVDTTTIFNQYSAWFAETTGKTESEINQWQLTVKAEFDQWFASIQNILDGDVAANLAVRITTLEQKLAMYQVEGEQHKFNNVIHDTYVACTTLSATAEKVVTTSGFTLTEGARITVKFAYANTATTPKLKINAEGAKPLVKADGTAFKNIKAGVYSFVYSGLNFTVQGEGGEYGTATAGDVLAGKTIGTENGIILGTLTYSKIQAGNMNKLINLTTQRILPWTYTTYTTYKKLQMNYTGSIRFTISISTYDNSNNTCGYKLLKNGATIKQTQKVNAVSETTDFSVLKGDLIELQLYSNENNKIIINTEIFSCDVIYNDGVIVDLNNLIGVL